jgi:hypothetical protein
MTAHWIKGGMFAAAAMLVFVSADADASKEKFVRDKPHVNIGTMGDEEAKEENEKKEAGTKVRKPMQDLKRSQGDEAGTLKGQTQTRSKRISGSVGKGGKSNRDEECENNNKFCSVATEVSTASPGGSADSGKKKDDDVASKTDKSDAARARRKN